MAETGKAGVWERVRAVLEAEIAAQGLTRRAIAERTAGVVSYNTICKVLREGESGQALFVVVLAILDVLGRDLGWLAAKIGGKPSRVKPTDPGPVLDETLGTIDRILSEIRRGYKRATAERDRIGRRRFGTVAGTKD